MLRYVALGNGNNWVADTIATSVSRLRVYVHGFYPYTDPIPLPDDIPVAVVLEAGDSAFSNTTFTNDGQWYRLQTELGSEPGGNPQGFTQYERLDPSFANVTNRNGILGSWWVTVTAALAMTGDPVETPSWRNYWYEREANVGGIWENINLTIDRTSRGTMRWEASVAAPYGTLDSRRNEYATRISLRAFNPTDPNGREILDWAASYLSEPYEWGGHWYGGKTGTHVGNPPEYEGYGIDCAGLVSAAARWAGYQWNSWRKYTFTLPSVSDVITPEDALPGDILNREHRHVVMILGREPGSDLIDTIEAVGDDDDEGENFVTTRNGRHIKFDFIERYAAEPRYYARRLRLNG